MYWIKLAGATDAADTTGQVSIEIPILGIEWTTELIGDTVTYADGTVKEPVQQRITYVIKAFPFTTNDYTAEFTIENIKYAINTVNAKPHKWIKKATTSGLVSPPRWADETNYPLTAFPSGKVKVGGFRFDIQPEWDSGDEVAVITALKAAVG